MEKKPFIFTFSRRLMIIWMRMWFRYTARGGEQVPLEGGCLIASNHASFLDPMVVGCGVMHRFVRFMARDTLFKNRLFLWWADGMGVVRINRSRGDVAALKDALAVLKKGGVLCVFPEGTRSQDGRLQKAKGGIGFLMAKAGVPVVPAYADGTFEALPKGAKRIKPHKITVSYGKPIFPFELAQFGKGRGAYEKMADFLMTRIAELQPE